MTTFPSILLIANADDAAEIFALLAKENIPQPFLGTGGDDSLDLFQARSPDLVLIVRGLEEGDLSSLTRALKSGQYGRSVPIVVILSNEEKAENLDGVLYDRVIEKTLLSKTLINTIRDVCLQASNTRMENAMDDAISDLMNEAVDSLELMKGDTSQSHHAEVEPTTPTPEVTWLETTLVLDGTPKEGGSGMDLESQELLDGVHGNPVESSLVEPFDSSGSAFDGPDSNSGDFAKQLREKMSAMAQRLFPGQAVGEEGSGIRSEVSGHTEIDLGAIVDEEAGLSQVETIFNEQASLASSQPQLFIDTEHLPGEKIETDSTTSSYEGEFDEGDNDIAAVLGRLSHNNYSGSLKLTRDDETKYIEFEEGAFVFASSEIQDDRMGLLLFREGKVSSAQLEECKSIMGETSLRMGEVLVDKGYLKPRELLPAVRRHLEDIFYSIFAWTSGSYHSEPSSKKEERIRLSRHPAALLVEGVRRKYEMDRLQEYMGKLEIRVQAKEKECNILLLDVELTPEELQAQGLFDGVLSIKEIALECGLSEIRVAQLAYAFVCLGAAEIVTGKGAELRSKSALSDGLNQAGEVDLAIDRQRLLAKYKLVQYANYFQILGVRMEASSFEVRRAYEVVRSQYALENYHSTLQIELLEMIQETLEVIEEAYFVLRQEVIRERYRQQCV